MIRYETQADILRLLEMLSRHFVAAAFSLGVARSFDASRIVTMASIACIADRVVRIAACDIPSQFSLHYSGAAEGPVKPFGFEMGYFLQESGFLEFSDVRLTTTRTQVLDYFVQQRAFIPATHMVFKFEHALEFGLGDKALMTQLCVQMGFNTSSKELPLYMSGENPVVADNYPELVMFRDIVYLFKALLSPVSSALPELRQWRATDARLTWKVKKEEKQVSGGGGGSSGRGGIAGDVKGVRNAAFVVVGFGKKLTCASFTKQYADGKAPERSALKSFLGVFGFGGPKYVFNLFLLL
jgi:hypothetical protein